MPNTWEIGENGYPAPIEAPDLVEPAMTAPYPAQLWMITDGWNNGYPFNALLPEIPFSAGAFENAASLAAVRVPISVKTIGATAFKGTALQRVKIATDCAYEETSFPAGCVVEHYDDDRYEQLRDCEGKAILDCDARRIYVRKAENTNG